MSITEHASAKINLFLHVGDKRADGFHPLQSLAVFTGAGDVLHAAAADQFSLEIDGTFAGTLGQDAPADNLVLRAARALAVEAGTLARAKLTLTKNLPVASGIGGGSADAAAALRALRALWRLDMRDEELRAIAADLGSDIPVCVSSVPAFMEGRGEILRDVDTMPRVAMVLVNPGVAVPTRDVFAALQDRSGAGMTLPSGSFADVDALLTFLKDTSNDLEAPARAIQPVIGTVLDALARLPGAIFTRMSGSGATCFSLFADDESCARAAAALQAAHPAWWIAPTFLAGR